MGTDLYIKQLLADGVSPYHLGKFVKLTPKHRKYVAVLCLAVRVPETIHHEIMKDDRLLARPKHYEQEVVAEFYHFKTTRQRQC